MQEDQTYRQQLSALWNDLERYQGITGNACQDLDCNGQCCNFEASAMMPCVTGMEWKVIREYLEDNSRELPFFQGLVCPFLLNNRCQIYAVRPTGCRIFFCNIQDRDFQGLMSWLERVKAIDPPGAEEYRPILDWFYGEYY